MNTEIKIKSLLPDLSFIGSRDAGEIIRNEMENSFENNKGVIIDFQGIDGVTQSFGDEVIGIFVRIKGVDFIKNNVNIINANDNIKKILNFVIHYSKKHFAA